MLTAPAPALCRRLLCGLFALCAPAGPCAAQIMPSVFIAQLHHAYQSKDRDLRIKVVEALGDLDSDDPVAVQTLSDALHDESALIATEAQGYLIEIINDHPTTVTVAYTALKDKDPAVRAAAATILGCLAEPDTAVASALLEARKDPDSTVRLKAVSGLSLMKPEDPRLFPALLEATHDPVPDVRKAAVTGLGQLVAQSPRSLSLLLDLSRDPDAEQRATALAALSLSDARNPQVVARVLDAMQDGELSVRQSALSALVTLHPMDPRVQEAVLAALHDRSADMRQSALAATPELLQARVLAPDRLIPALLTLFRDRETQAGWRAQVLKALIQIHHEHGLDTLVQADLVQCYFTSLQDGDAGVRGVALKGISECAGDDPRLLTAVLSALRDHASEVRQTAIELAVAYESIGIRNERLQRNLPANLAGPDGDAVRRLLEVRRAALEAAAGNQAGNMRRWRGRRNPVFLSDLAPPDLLQRLPELRRALGAALTAALNATADAPRQRALRTLDELEDTRVRDPGLVPALIKAVGDPDRSLHAGALDALCRFGEGDPEAKRIILVALKDPERRVRAVNALLRAEGMDPEVVTGLLPLLRADDADLRLNTAVALLRFGKGNTRSSADGAERAALSVLIALMQSGQDVRIRDTVISALESWMPTDTACDSLLLPLVKHELSFMRVFAVQRLAQVAERDPAAYAALRVGLGDSDRSVRLALIAALGSLPANHTSPLTDLVPALQDRDPEVQTKAAAMIVQIADRLAADPHRVMNLPLLRDIRALQAAQAGVKALRRATPADIAHPDDLLPRLQRALLRLKAEARRRLGA